MKSPHMSTLPPNIDNRKEPNDRHKMHWEKNASIWGRFDAMNGLDQKASPLWGKTAVENYHSTYEKQLLVNLVTGEYPNED